MRSPIRQAAGFGAATLALLLGLAACADGGGGSSAGNAGGGELNVRVGGSFQALYGYTSR